MSFWSPQLIEKDLVVLISQRAPHSPEIVVEVAADGSGCAMLTMVPEFDLDPEPAEIVFLVDCSGSMDLHRISAARQALGVFLRSLPISCRFNLVKFGSRYHSLFPAMSTQPYTAASFQKAANYISGITATYGGTDIATPLREIFRQPVSPGYSRQLFVLTDGEVSNTEAVIELCRTNARNTRVFSVGIGEEVSHHLVEGMARASSGTAVFIQGRELTDSSLGVFESKLITLLKAATLPSITKISVDWGHLGPVVAPVLPAAPEGSCSSSAAAIPPLDYYTHLPNSLAPAAASDPSLQSLSSQTLQAPFLPPPLFSGSKFVLFAFFPPGQLPVSHATLTAQAPGGQLNIDIPVTLLKSGGRTLHLLAARALIRDLEEGTFLSFFFFPKISPFFSSLSNLFSV
ncbi:MAG: VWA domain-containing protein [archaeon]|nr:VWA domain-containing protein [archaeon]